ncbi:MAG: putative O-glycosylation ligase, exosortase A system-associated [Candidatus Solibacter sp.]|nr:putative O-glycosylation ligase, exosortase A system-associated [Candidatus Solibacter sp.]
MRDAVLMVIVAIISVMALYAPRYGLLGYLWFSLFRPDILAYSAGRPYSMILAIVTGVSALRAVPRVAELMINPIVWVFMGFQVWCGLSVLTALRQDLCFPSYTWFLTSSVISLFIPLLVRTKEHLRLLLQVLGGSIGLLGAKMGLYGILAGGAMFVQGVGGFLADNNLVALGLVMGVPLLWYSILLTDMLPLKSFFGFLLVTTLAAIVMCHSRGGILALALVLMLMAWRAKYRMAAFVFIALMALPGAWLVRDSLIARMSTLSSFQEDESAMGRLAFWKAALKVSKDYPLFGVGFGGTNYREISGKYVEGDFTHANLFVHNTYLQVLVDSGYPAAIAYCILLLVCILWMRRLSKKLKEDDPEMARWSEAIGISLAGYSVGAMFLSRVNYDFPYMLFLAAATVYQIHAMQQPVAGQAPAGESADAPPPSSPLPAHDDMPAIAGDNQPAWKRAGAGRRLRLRQKA